VAPPTDRPLLEHLLYACCLENARHETVDEVFAKLEQNYFDWNEVRVTTVAELAEVLSVLPDAADAARRLKRTLQGVFEGHYSFDLEFLRKQNLGKAIQELEKLSGVTRFALAYVTQTALGGHSIPVNQGAFAALQVLGSSPPQRWRSYESREWNEPSPRIEDRIRLAAPSTGGRLCHHAPFAASPRHSAGNRPGR